MSAIDEHIKMISDTIMNCKVEESENALKDLKINLRKEDGSIKTIYELFSELYDKMYGDEKYDFLDSIDEEPCNVRYDKSNGLDRLEKCDAIVVGIAGIQNLGDEE